MTEIGQEEVAGRLVRALRLDSVLPNAERGVLRAKVLWPSYSYDRADLNAQFENEAWLRQIAADAARRREWDTRPARQDYLEVMAWLCEMTRLGVETRRTVRRKAADVGLPMVEFVRRVALDHDWWSIAMAEAGGERPSRYGAENARRRWAGVVMVATDVVNGRIGSLYVAPGVLRAAKAAPGPSTAPVLLGVDWAAGPDRQAEVEG